MEVSEYTEQGIGEKGEAGMKKKIVYTDAPKNISRAITDGEIVANLIPPPEDLIRRDSKVKITIMLNSGSIEFFKKHAQENNVKYQTMINEVLDRYVQTYK
ncbi:MAG: BrnA antitoxin family protein [Lachnospiraceae bacterium]|jgi:predicted DNA binding CopG/RHH family protein|nr:BrnA antitoxin family protein [Lachnospiraceae bacterium]